MSILDKLISTGIDPTREVALLRKTFSSPSDKRGVWVDAQLGFLCEGAGTLVSTKHKAEKIDFESDIVILCGGQWGTSLAVVRVDTYLTTQKLYLGYCFKDQYCEVIVSQEEHYLETAACVCSVLSEV